MTEQATTTQIPAAAIEDMRDTLLEMGFVGADRAPEANVLKTIARKFGSVEHYVNHFGPY